MNSLPVSKHSPERKAAACGSNLPTDRPRSAFDTWVAPPGPPEVQRRRKSTSHHGQTHALHTPLVDGRSSPYPTRTVGTFFSNME